MVDFNWAYIIPILLVLVLIHELGHFAAARWVGIKVEEFGFGLPPRLFGFTHKGVLYSINALPIGGFVRMLGEDRMNEDPASFNQKRPWQRALVVVAGALMNLLLAMVLLTAIAAGHGRAAPTGQTEIRGVEDGSPAAAAGWRSGDIIVSIAGQPITEYQQIGAIIQERPGQPVQVTIRRGQQTLETTVTPRVDPPPGSGAMGIIIGEQVRYVPLPLGEAIAAGVTGAMALSWAMLQGLGMMLESIVNPAVDVGPVAGPIGMGQFVGEAVAQSQLPLWVTLATLTALISLNLFLINLLPLPALDGGRLIFILVEVVRGRRVHPNYEGMVHLVGLVLLLALIAVISFFDISRLLEGQPLMP